METRNIVEKFTLALEENKDFKVKGSKFYLFSKRLFDIVASFIAIIIFSPIFVIIGLLVLLSSKGPIIYKSKRVTQNGKIFKMYKFRSMYNDADKRKQELLQYNEIDGGITFKMKNDPRITPIGKFLRKTSLDELPQLFNIVRGDMSLIGPRAPLPEEVLKYSNKDMLRLTVKQGVSGEWQTHGRSNTTFDEMIDMDLDYIQNKRSFFYDIKLCFLTVFVTLTGKGAR